jgi:hypothetical protein
LQDSGSARLAARHASEAAYERSQNREVAFANARRQCLSGRSLTTRQSPRILHAGYLIPRRDCPASRLSGGRAAHIAILREAKRCERKPELVQ